MLEDDEDEVEVRGLVGDGSVTIVQKLEHLTYAGVIGRADDNDDAVNRL